MTPRPIPSRLRKRVAGSFFAPPALAGRRQAKRVRRTSAEPNEASIQTAVIGHLRRRAVEGAIFWHTPNGGSRGRIEGARLKAQGVLPGIPDVFVLRAGQLFGLELKTGTGRLSEAQSETQLRLIAAGCIAETVFGLDMAVRQLEAWGLLKGRADLPAG
jgi:hypothetical protein